MKRQDGQTIVAAVVRGIAPTLRALESRLAVLERVAGVEKPPAQSHNAGDVIEMGGAKWVCRGAGRWRKLEDV